MSKKLPSFKIIFILNLKYCLLFLFINVYSILLAQPKANFIPSSTSGCSPLVVSFTNTTTGTSNSATYKWDFGNSNSSSNKDAATTYTIEQSYTVTLTVTDNGSTSTKSMIITVLKNPAPSFTVDASTGCAPFNVSFKSTSSLGTGNTGYYYWDFGDGTTINGDSSSQFVNHDYKNPGYYTIKLQVKTNTGCATTLLSKANFINALTKPTANYVRSKAYLCNAGDAVSFTNNSIVEPNATYLWKFGDAATSSSSSPTHTYSNVGVFADSLIVTNTNGCSDTSFSPTPIYSASFMTNFITPKGMCAESSINFTNISTPIPDVANWYVSSQSSAISGINMTKIFNKAGTYTVKLVNLYGTCLDSISKTITVLPSYSIGGFSVSSAPLCGGKTMITLTDTTNSFTTSWNIDGLTETLLTNPASYTFTHDSTYNISLSATNTAGCAAKVVQNVEVKHVPVYITSTSDNPISNTSGCPGLKVKFNANPSTDIISYAWTFGDYATISTDSSPTHTYDSTGSFAVTLKYTSLDGCSDSAYLRNITTFLKPKPAFSVMSQDVCGGSVSFFDKTPLPVTSWFWYFGDSLHTRGNSIYSTSIIQNPKHFYFDTGYYDIKLIATNGTCSDSITNTQYIHIKTPISQIDSTQFPCSGERNTVKFTGYYKSVVSGTWDFGDGSPIVLVDTTVRTISHQFPGTGNYRVVLTTTNGGCTPKDTIWVPVLLRQHPILKANLTSICANDSLKVMIDTSTLARNPSVWNDSIYYSIYAWQYGDSSVFSQGLSEQPNWYFSYLGMLKGLIPGKTDLRVITKSANYGCLDTSNFINLKVKGPVGGYYINSPKDCFKKPLTFIDTSKTNFGVPITKWIWNYGDNTFDTLTTNSNVTHMYPFPGKFATELKVVDSDGCFDISKQSDSAFPSGPKVNFRWSPNYIITGTTASFINTSNAYGNTLVDFFWTFFGDGTHANTYNTSHTYNKTEVDSVQLIAVNPLNGCRDSVYHLVPIKRVFAVFTIKTKYSNRNTCPPMQAVFTSRSINADRLKWDFGDGSGKALSTDTFASHTYNDPGIYVVTLYAYKNSLLLDSSSQTITVKGAYATVTSDLTQGCIHSTVSLKSTQVNTTAFTWDFGDGTVILNSPDSFITHEYVTAGIYTPHILLTDVNGCKSSFPAIKPIIIDSLHTSFKMNRIPVCDTGTVLFTPHIVSFSSDSLQKTLTYHWTFGTGNPKDTSNVLAPTFRYNTIGSYPVTQFVTSVYGCSASFEDSVFVKPSSRGIITAPAKACEGDSITFTATQSFPGNVLWHWIFNNGDSSLIQNPKAEVFTSAKDSISHYTIQLVTMLNNCYDTTLFPLTVNPYPRVGLVPKVKQICEGDTAKLAAFDGTQFFWSPDKVPVTQSTPTVSPIVNTNYYVKVANVYGCSKSDTATINVTPLVKKTLVFSPDAIVCKGLSVQLNVSGADNYVWLKDSSTLINYSNNSSNPIATPVAATTIYQFDAWNGLCKHDTNTITVIQVPFPTISISDTMTMLTGYQAKLNATVSPDVVTYKWSPSDYLSDSISATPICSPKHDIVYTLNVTNANGCSVKDSISIHLICSESLFLPSAFIPSSTYKNNDKFFPQGVGVKEILFLRVYNRGGELIFESTHFQPNDLNRGWDGTFKGKQVAPGTYVYMLQAQCDTGEYFERKGTIVLIR